jgi:hypothetical protein
MLLAVAHPPVTGAEFLKLTQDQRNHVLNLLVRIFDDTVVGQAQ